MSGAMEFSLWLVLRYREFFPGWKVGPFRVWARVIERTVKLVRVYPTGVGLPSDTPTTAVVDKLLAMGYESLAWEAVEALIQLQLRVQKRGYIVVPLKSGGQARLEVENGFLRRSDDELSPGTLETAGYSVIVQRPE